MILYCVIGKNQTFFLIRVNSCNSWDSFFNQLPLNRHAKTKTQRIITTGRIVFDMGNTFDAILVTVKAATAGNALPFATVPQKENFAWYRFKTGQARTKKVLIHRRVRRVR